MESKVIELCGAEWVVDGRHILEKTDFTLRRGEFVAVAGPNGGGKTTLVRMLLKLLKPTSGSVDYFNAEGKRVKSLPIGYLPQKSQVDSRFPITVSEVVETALLGKGIVRQKRRTMVGDILDRFDLSRLANAAIGEISGGQLQRALIARALVADPELIIFDEPLSYLDITNSHRLIEILREMSATKTIMVVTHNFDLFKPLASRLLTVEHGIVISSIVER